MYAAPGSPISPSRQRRSIRLSSFKVPEEDSPSPYTSGTTNGTTFSRRSSRTSQSSFLQSPTTPRPMSERSSRPPSFYHRRKSSSRFSTGSNISLDANEGGLGNLADELEDALEDEYEVNGSGFLDGLREGDAVFSPQSPDRVDWSLERESLPTSPTSERIPQPKQSSPTGTREKRNRHERTDSRYDNNDFRSGLDQEECGFAPGLIRRFRDIESLTRTSPDMEDEMSEGGGLIKRTTHALKDLGPQANIESSFSRIISAYTSMASHRTHKTRELFNQTHSLLRGNIWDLPDETFDELLVDVEMLISTVSFNQLQNPLLSLQSLASQTLDLAYALRSLTDLLQESRIQANNAARKLKSVKDMTEEVGKEHELVETSMILIQAGDWDRRCRERQAAATCRDVIRGFGERWDLEVEERPWTHECHEVV